MEYRTMGEEKVSLLGFGAMRLPVRGEWSDVDFEESVRMIRYAIDSGVNYVDTAYTYHFGKGEEAVGMALKDGYREKVLLADKMPVWIPKNEVEMEDIFNTQLERLQENTIDCYLLHNLTKDYWAHCKRIGALDFVEKKRAEGKLRYIGFSFHDDLETFKEILDAYPWDFCQIQFNYMDTEFQAGLEGLQYAGEKGIPVVIMEPLKGGRLAVNLPDTVQAVLDAQSTKRSAADWAFRYVADFPEVLTVLSGLREMRYVEEDLQIFEDCKAGGLTEAEHAMFAEAAETFRRIGTAQCTGCKYCQPCPHKVSIPVIIDHYNDYLVYRNLDAAKLQLSWNVTPKHAASNCTGCGVCVEKCPQKLPIPELMAKAAELFG